MLRVCVCFPTLSLTVIDARLIFVLSLGGRCSSVRLKVRALKRKTEDTNLQNAV